MGKASTRVNIIETTDNKQINLDARGLEILRLVLSGRTNREIAIKLKIPMSTIQRRTRYLFQTGLVRYAVELDHRRMGLRKGLLHVYVRDGDVNHLADRIAGIRGIRSVSIHIGNSDVVGSFIFKDAGQLLDVINQAKKFEGVDRVLWSEEVFSLPQTDEDTILESD